jgi:hypothetical protein
LLRLLGHWTLIHAAKVPVPALKSNPILISPRLMSRTSVVRKSAIRFISGSGSACLIHLGVSWPERLKQSAHLKNPLRVVLVIKALARQVKFLHLYWLHRTFQLSGSFHMDSFMGNGLLYSCEPLAKHLLLGNGSRPWTIIPMYSSKSFFVAKQAWPMLVNVPFLFI